MHLNTNKLIFLLLALSFFSCKQEGVKVESNVAKAVKTSQNVNQIEYALIENASVINWTATHLGGVDPRIGRIDIKEASIIVIEDEIANVSMKIDMERMTVDNIPEDGAKELVDHLKSDDFFKIKEFPISQFDLTSLEENKGEYNSIVIGNLEILGIIRSIQFKANVEILTNEISINTEKFTIDRSDWGMTYNAKGTAGVPLDYLISDDIGFQITARISR